MSGGELLFHNT